MVAVPEEKHNIWTAYIPPDFSSRHETTTAITQILIASLTGNADRKYRI